MPDSSFLVRRSNVYRTTQIRSSLCSYEDSTSGRRDMRGRMMAHVDAISVHPHGPDVSNPPFVVRFPSMPLEAVFYSVLHPVCIVVLHFLSSALSCSFAHSSRHLATLPLAQSPSVRCTCGILVVHLSPPFRHAISHMCSYVLLLSSSLYIHTLVLARGRPR